MKCCNTMLIDGVSIHGSHLHAVALRKPSQRVINVLLIRVFLSGRDLEIILS